MPRQCIYCYIVDYLLLRTAFRIQERGLTLVFMSSYFFSTESSHLFLLYKKKTQPYFNCLEGQETFQTNCNIQGESHRVRSLEVFSMMSEQVIENGCRFDYNERPSHEVFREVQKNLTERRSPLFYSVQKNDDKSFDR